MRVVFDLDGVLRDLNEYMVSKFKIPYPDKWGWKHEGKTIYQIIPEDGYEALTCAPPTEYYPTILGHLHKNGSEIWTSQPKKWRGPTTAWVKKYLTPTVPIKFFNSGEEKRELLNDEKDVILVEDYPRFKSYERIILIDRPYNRDAKADIRISNPRGLDLFLREVT